MRPFFLLLLSVFLFSCQKGSLKKHCWQIVDFSGNVMLTECGLTEAALNRKYPDLGECHYFSEDDPTYCWQVDSRFIENRSEKWIKCFIPTAKKLDCNTCGTWYTREKYTIQPGNKLLYGGARKKFYCGDTITIFKSGKPFVIKNTPDTLIVLQYSSDGRVWF